MAFFQEFREFLKSITVWFCLLLVFAGFFFLFGIKEVDVLGKVYFLPLPTDPPFSVQLFEKMQQDLLPSGVQLIVTNPLSAFLSQIKISLSMAFFLSFPYFLFRIIGFFAPALYKKEKKAMLKLLFPSLILFAGGCSFAYFILIPPTFKILYSYTIAMGALPYFSVTEFVTLIFGFMMAVGIMFLLPIFMVLLTRMGIVENTFWKENWKYSFLFFLIFSAIITPDGTGITMIILSVPLSLLYFLGIGIGGRHKIDQ